MKHRLTHRLTHTLQQLTHRLTALAHRIGSLIGLCGSLCTCSARCISSLFGSCTGSLHPFTASAKGIGSLPRPLHVIHWTLHRLCSAHCMAHCIPPPASALLASRPRQRASLSPGWEVAMQSCEAKVRRQSDWFCMALFGRQT